MTPVHAAGFSHCAVLSKILHGWSLFGGPSHMGPRISSCYLSYRLSKTPSHWALVARGAATLHGISLQRKGTEGTILHPHKPQGTANPTVCEPGLTVVAVQGSWGVHGLNSQTRGTEGFTSKSGMAFPSGSEC